MSRPKYSGSEQDTVALEHIYTKWVSETLPLAAVEHSSRHQSTSYKTARTSPDREGRCGPQEQPLTTNCGGPVKISSAPSCL